MAQTPAPQKREHLKLLALSTLAFLGAILSAILTQHFYEVRNGLSGFKSFCNVSQSFNCDAIAVSRFAEFLFGIPLSSISCAAFLALFLTSLFAYDRFWRREAIRLSLVFTVIGSLFSLFYFFVMIFQLKTYCILCLMVDAAIWGALLLVVSLKPEKLSLNKPKLSQWKSLAGVAGATLLLTPLLLTVFNPASIKTADLAAMSKAVLDTAPIPVKVGDEFPSIGPKDAPISVVEFSDFQCPFCRMAALSLHSVVNRYPGKIKVYFRNYPLDQACNPTIQNTVHPSACSAAQVAYCAFRQSKFESIYETFFDKQASFLNTAPLEVARPLGLDVSLLKTCMDSTEMNTAIARDISEATLLGITSTPTFFINGHRMEGAYPAEAWYLIIDQLL